MASDEVKSLKRELKEVKAASKKDNPASTKLKHDKAAQVGVGLVITVLLQTQAKFGDFAGDFTPAVYMGVVVVVGAVVGYVKRDPQRVSKTMKQWMNRQQ